MPSEVSTDFQAGKSGFDDIYDRADPYGYYDRLQQLSYEIPAHGTTIFRRLLDRMDDATTVLDLCCSYGINAALLNHTLDLDDLYEHYGSDERQALTDEGRVAADRSMFAEHLRGDAADVIGLDVAGNALAYGVSAGLLSEGLQADLESTPATDETATQLESADLVTVTGGIGYIGKNTFDRILDAAGDQLPWVAALSLRWVDFEPVHQSMERHGLKVDKADRYVVPQRRFTTPGERDAAFAGLASLGLEPTHVEEAGFHGAEFYLARPNDVADDFTIDEVVDGLVDQPV